MMMFSKLRIVTTALVAVLLLFVVVADVTGNNDNDTTATATPKKRTKPLYIGESLQKYLQERDQKQHQEEGQEGEGEGEGERKLKPRERSEEILNLIIEYIGDAADDDDCLQNSGNVETDIPSLHLAGFATTDIDAVLDCPNIASVEFDTLYYADIYERQHDHELRGVGGQRLLAETEPAGLAMVQADLMAGITDTPTEVMVCVVDTGYDNGHIDLPTLSVPGDGNVPTYDVCRRECTGWWGTNCQTVCDDYYGDDNWHIDGNAHGTHVAGTIGALKNNEGVNSVMSYSSNKFGSNFRFYIGKGLSDSGSGYSSAIVDTIVACKDKANSLSINNIVVNLSLGGAGYSSAIENAYLNLYLNDNVLFVAASGNTGNSANHYPASYASLMGVAAVNTQTNSEGIKGEVASFSTRNSQTEIAAPGHDVISTTPGNNYASYSGTSMAAPHVTGVAALVWSYFPECTNSQIRNALLLSADEKLGGCNPEYGHGMVQARAAYDLLKSRGCSIGGTTVTNTGGCGQVDRDALLQGTPPPTKSPTAAPTKSPTASPTGSPTKAPTPTVSPTASPTKTPTTSPTASPTKTPTTSPTASPTPPPVPTISPTASPTKSPTASPTKSPTTSPTPEPTPLPTPEPVQTCCQCRWFGCRNWCC